MRTKSAAQIKAQANKIQSGYGWKAQGDKWSYEKYMAIADKVQEISDRYIRAIGRHQRAAEGWTKEQQARQFETVYNLPYPREIYAK